MRLKFLLVLIIGLLFTLPPVQATELSMARELELRLQLASTMVQFQKRIESEWKDEGDLLQKLESDQNYRSVFEGRYSEIVNDYLKAEIDHLPLNATLKKDLGKKLAALDWQQFSKRVVDLLLKARSFVRSQGIAQALIYVANTTFQFTIPPLLMAHGHPILASILFYSAGDIPVFLAHSFLKRYYLKYKLMMLMGDREKFGLYMKSMERAGTELKLTSVLGDLLVPLGKDEALVLESVNPIQVLLKRFGLRQGKVSLRRLRAFVKEQNVTDDLTNYLLFNSAYPDNVKMALALPKLMEVMKPQEELAFRARFSASITSLPQIPTGSELEDWLISIAKSDTWTEVQERFLRSPVKLHPMQSVMVWEHVLLPYFAQRVDLLSYRQYRHLSRQFARLKASAFLARYEVGEDFLARLWSPYLSFSSCHADFKQAAKKYY